MLSCNLPNHVHLRPATSSDVDRLFTIHCPAGELCPIGRVDQFNVKVPCYGDKTLYVRQTKSCSGHVVRIADSWWAGDFECDPREFAVAPSRALVTITKGQTSRAEVLALLGPLDIEATEANAKTNPSSPLAEYYREGLRHFRTAESDWLALLPYS